MRSAFLVFCLLTMLLPCPACQTKNEEQAYKVSKDIKPARAISTPMPDFSSEAKRIRIHGSVVVGAQIGVDGKVHDPKVLKSIGDPGLDAKALDAVKTWKFKPCTKDGKPIVCGMNLQIAIDLD